MKYAATEQATTFLSEQIKGLQAEIEQKQSQLQGFEAEANIIALSDTETTVIDRLSQLNKALTEAQIERSQKEATWNGLKNVSADYVPEAITNPLIQRLREEYVRLKRETQKMEERFQPDYPELQRMKVEMESARRSLEDETQNLVKGAYSEFQTALNKERSLETEFDEQKNEAFKMNSSAVLYNGLKVEIQNKKTLLDSLLRRESETGVEARLKGLRTSNIRVVDRARDAGQAVEPEQEAELDPGAHPRPRRGSGAGVPLRLPRQQRQDERGRGAVRGAADARRRAQVHASKGRAGPTATAEG